MASGNFYITRAILQVFWLRLSFSFGCLNQMDCIGLILASPASWFLTVLPRTSSTPATLASSPSSLSNGSSSGMSQTRRARSLSGCSGLQWFRLWSWPSRCSSSEPTSSSVRCLNSRYRVGSSVRPLFLHDRLKDRRTHWQLGAQGVPVCVLPQQEEAEEEEGRASAGVRVTSAWRRKLVPLQTIQMTCLLILVSFYLTLINGIHFKVLSLAGHSWFALR